MQSPVVSRSPNKKSLENRIQNFKKISGEISSEIDIHLHFDDANALKISDNIYLIRIIGSQSAFGIVYVAEIKKANSSSLRFACKLQLNDKTGKLERFLLDKLCKISLDANNCHFPIIYKNIDHKMPTEDISRYPLMLQNTGNVKSYILTLNEIANGDFKSFFKSHSSDSKLVKNAIEQIYMSLAFIHSHGIMHKDSHYGNFLYHKIDAGGYFHYNINGTDYYIENQGILWTIWDFGVSSPIFRFSDYMEDYNLLCLFMRHDNPTKITEDFKKKYKMEEKNIDPKTNRMKKTGKISHRKYGNIDDSIYIPYDISVLVDTLWKESGEDKNIDSKLINQDITEQTFLQNLLDNGIMFKKAIQDPEHTINTLNINFETKAKNQILMNKTSFINIPTKYL